MAEADPAETADNSPAAAGEPVSSGQRLGRRLKMAKLAAALAAAAAVGLVVGLALPDGGDRGGGASAGSGHGAERSECVELLRGENEFADHGDDLSLMMCGLPLVLPPSLDGLGGGLGSLDGLGGGLGGLDRFFDEFGGSELGDMTDGGPLDDFYGSELDDEGRHHSSGAWDEPDPYDPHWPDALEDLPPWVSGLGCMETTEGVEGGCLSHEPPMGEGHSEGYGATEPGHGHGGADCSAPPGAAGLDPDGGHWHDDGGYHGQGQSWMCPPGAAGPATDCEALALSGLGALALSGPVPIAAILALWHEIDLCVSARAS